MGLIQRVIEEGGIPTVSISLSREITRKVKPPRAIFAGLNLGHPMGEAHNPSLQKKILRMALKSLVEIKQPGTIVDINLDDETDCALSCSICSR